MSLAEKTLKEVIEALRWRQEFQKTKHINEVKRLLNKLVKKYPDLDVELQVLKKFHPMHNSVHNALMILMDKLAKIVNG